MKKPSVYDKLETFIHKRGEKSFFPYFYGDDFVWDWDKISNAWHDIKVYCNMNDIRMGWHSEILSKKDVSKE